MVYRNGIEGVACMTPRAYQIDCIEAVVDQFRTHQSTVAVLATGLGKTAIAAFLAKRAAAKGRVMFLAHREELIDQAASTLAYIADTAVDIEMADRRASVIQPARIVASSVQTQISGRNGTRRMHAFDPSQFSLVIQDEAHHATGDNSFGAVLCHYKQNAACRILGITATPNRTDRKALGECFDSVAFRMGIEDGIAEGWLVDIEQRYVSDIDVDYGAIQVRLGDFASGELSEVMRSPQVIHAVCAAVRQYGRKRILVFSVDVQHAENITEALNEFSPGYAHIVTGETPTVERRKLIEDYRKGRYPCLVQCMISSEGFDVPAIDTVVMARPTKSTLLYTQMIGRGTRPLADVDQCDSAASRQAAIAASGKRDLLVVDFVGNSLDHQIVTAVDVLGGVSSDAAKELAERRIAEKGGGNVRDELRRADAELQAAEAKRKATARTSDSIISPFGRDDPFKTFGIRNEGGKEPVEPWQRDKLEKWRMPVPQTADEAQALIDEVRRRTRRGLATFRMVRILERNGVRNARELMFDAARVAIDGIAQRQGWSK
jgi:superfamily II DNA or RNA helicase